MKDCILLQYVQSSARDRHEGRPCDHHHQLIERKTENMNYKFFLISLVMPIQKTGRLSSPALYVQGTSFVDNAHGF